MRRTALHGSCTWSTWHLLMAPHGHSVVHWQRHVCALPSIGSGALDLRHSDTTSHGRSGILRAATQVCSGMSGHPHTEVLACTWSSNWVLLHVRAAAHGACGGTWQLRMVDMAPIGGAALDTLWCIGSGSCAICHLLASAHWISDIQTASHGRPGICGPPHSCDLACSGFRTRISWHAHGAASGCSCI